jgi:hypothetical protein
VPGFWGGVRFMGQVAGLIGNIQINDQSYITITLIFDPLVFRIFK